MIMRVDDLRSLRRQARVEQVLDAAAQLFVTRGYEATRMDEIAASASVAPATVYNYFSSKRNLLMALVLRHLRASLPERRAFVRDLPEDPMVAVVEFERLLARQALRHLSRDCWRVIMLAERMEPQGRAGRAGARFNTLIHRHYVQMLRHYAGRGRLRADLDVGALARLIVAATTWEFGQFVSDPAQSVDDMLGACHSHVGLIMEGLVILATNLEPTPG